MKLVLKAFKKHVINSYVISFPKSGRTWLKHIISCYIKFAYNCYEKNAGFREPIKNSLWRKFPNIEFTHDVADIPYQDNYSYDSLINIFNPRIYSSKNNILLIRDPRDVVVSYYHHKVSREKIIVGKAPYSGTIDDFIKDSIYGIKKIVVFMNLWAQVLRDDANYMLVRYEDMRRNEFEVVEKILNHFGVIIDKELLESALKASSFENMKKEERILLSGKLNDNNQMKTRKGMVGGYNDEISDDMVSYIDVYINDNLDSLYDYYSYHTCRR